ncbi:MAG: ATP-grasp domain-containing protein [Atopobiaceae bacterium]|nr:ATP-grasp domain-containing protein [Atopobiaceae bacterium]MCH4276649.1 ATP-grasp domain-containing protein [Atopobiaceae bacterium]MCI1259553.1 ATP-grasp domain-containing protein [Atopobiaceae bacterium]MDD3176985.1 ATP-grasp domain-containing protein [Atopobiaceae bacterium]
MAGQGTSGKSQGPRHDLVPVVIGGDIGVYAIGREFHEAFGTKVACVSDGCIGAIRHSSIFEQHEVPDLEPDTIARALSQIGEAAPDAHVVVMHNTDHLVDVLGQVADDLPSNVTCAIPGKEPCRLLSDKVTFAQCCRQHGLDVPETEVAHLAGSSPIEPTCIPFPLVAKPAVSAAYAHLLRQGFKKVYFIHAQHELDELWGQLRDVGFEGDFLVQELIEGDDTYMDSLTIYMGANGKATMLGSAQVLLEDHAPTMLGNPVVMVTRPMPELWEKVEAMLADVGYHGFANFDIKRNRRDGRSVFLEMNPRIGRNSFYNLAAGVNPMRVLVDDVVDGIDAGCLKAEEKILYTLVPTSLIPTYLRDPDLLAEVRALIAEKRVFDPQRYQADSGPRRMLDVELTERNQVRKFARYYPEPTDTSF